MTSWLKKYLKTFKYIRILNYKFNKSYTNFNKLNLNKNSIVIDIGLNIGSITQLIEDKYDCYIDCYEYKIIPELIKNKSKIKKVICELHGNPINNKNQFLNKDHKELITKLKKIQLYDDWFLEHF